MTRTLEKAFQEASKLPAAEQEVFAGFILDELAFRAAVREGIEAADRDEVVPHEEIGKMIPIWASKTVGVIVFFLLLGLAGCSTEGTFQPRADAPVAPPKPADYPICVYAEGMEVPRAFATIGTLQTVGKSPDDAIAKLMTTARQKGADAIQIQSLESPTFLNTKYQLDAGLIRFTDAWESLPWTEAQFKAYLAANPSQLDPIEEIWTANDVGRSRVAIMRDHAKPGRDFFAFVLGTKNKSWQPGYKKLELAHDPQRSDIYQLKFYQDDFQMKEAVTVLGELQPGAFVVQWPDSDTPIDFVEE